MPQNHSEIKLFFLKSPFFFKMTFLTVKSFTTNTLNKNSLVESFHKSVEIE
jgi:hypothetical protein